MSESYLDWLTDPFGALAGILQILIWNTFVSIPVLLMAAVALLWPFIVITGGIAFVWIVGDMINMLLDSKTVRFVLATKQWPRNVLTTLVILWAIVAAASSNGLLGPALSSIAGAYAANLTLWVVTASIVLFILGVGLSYAWMNQSLAFRTFDGSKLLCRR